MAADPPHQFVYRAGLWRSDGTPLRLLLADDESLIRHIVSATLRHEGSDVIAVADGKSAVAAARHTKPDVVILGSNLADMSATHVLNLLREYQPGIPILLLTRGATIPGGVAPVSAGGDDWLSKPFGLETMLLNLRTLVRRGNVDLMYSASEIVVGDLVLDDDSQDVTRGDGASIYLSRKEFELLRFLMRNAQRVVAKQQILRGVWPYDFTGQLNVVELYVSYLRKKIDVDHPPMIHTLRRSGYILKAARSS